MVGHIEDIAVLSDQRGKKLGKRLIEALDSIAQKVGCYKVCFQRLYLVNLVRVSLIALKPMKGSM
jgi:ribosomal protein S18 acetylase RimI-like enzyme